MVRQRAGILLGLLSILFAAQAFSEQPLVPTAREVLTCGKREGDLFKGWARMAGHSTPASALKSLSNADIFSVQMSDGRTIRGIRARAAGRMYKFVLVIPGNGWIAQTFDPYISQFAKAGFDVYVPDFRGYGLSQPAVPTMQGIVADYRDLSRWIWAQQYRRGYVYAFSFGGVVAVDALDLRRFSRVVLDAAPAHPAQLLGLTCSVSYDPEHYLPGSCRNVVLMHGTRDWVLRRWKVQDLINAAAKCGATLDIGKPRGHPFQLEWPSTSEGRVQDVIQHFGAQ